MPAPPAARRLVYLAAAAAPAWAAITAVTGGVSWVAGPLRLSSTEPVRPLLVGLLAAIVYAWQSTPAERDGDGLWLERHLTRALPLALAVLVAAGFVLGVRHGSFTAAGSDSYGYVSQARLWLDGTLRVHQPWVQDLPWPNREWAFTPLGYRPLSADGTIVPTYPPGLPLLMAAFLGLFGDDGPYYVVPVAGALAVWLTYLLGRTAIGSRPAALLAALLLLSSPVFLMHLMLPMSDVPAAAGWALVTLLALHGAGRESRPVLAGAAAGVSVLIRPSLLALAAVPAVSWRFRPRPLVRYAVGLAPLLLALAIINTILYGSPQTFGYGSLGGLYALGAAPQNLVNYGTWLVETQTPLVVLGLLPLFVSRALRGDAHVSPRGSLLALIGLTLGSYVFYGVFDNWTYLRFLLPAYPAVFVLVAAAIRFVCLRLPVAARAPAAVCAATLLTLSTVTIGQEAGAFRQQAYEQRYVRAAASVAERTPPTAVILAVQHSGSVRHYTNRITLRYDWLAKDHLDAALRDLRARGHHPFIVLDDMEEAGFRDRFGSYSRAGRLDWRPLVRVEGDPEVRIYDLEGPYE